MIHDRITWLSGLLDEKSRAELLTHAEQLFMQQIAEEPTEPGLGPWVALLEEPSEPAPR